MKMRAGIPFFKLRREMAAICCGVILLIQTDCRLLCVSLAVSYSRVIQFSLFGVYLITIVKARAA